MVIYRLYVCHVSPISILLLSSFPRVEFVGRKIRGTEGFHSEVPPAAADAQFAFRTNQCIVRYFPSGRSPSTDFLKYQNTKYPSRDLIQSVSQGKLESERRLKAIELRFFFLVFVVSWK